MLQVHYSDSLDALLQRLAGDVAAQPFSLVQPATILVPNANVAKWLKMQFAQINGVAMNVDFPYLERGLWDLTCSVTGTDPTHAQPTSAEQSRFALAARLVVALEQEENNPLAAFCLNGQAQFSRHDPDQVRRVWQLSTDLSRLFREYEYHRGLSPLDSRRPPRPGMLNDRDLIGFWLNPGNDLADVPESLLPTSIRSSRRDRLCSLFAAQGNLYRDAVNALRRGSPPEISLPSLARQTPWHDLAATKTCPTVHLFGISQLSPFHCWLLHHLGRHADLHLYHFNICREFWEDVETPGELRRSLQRTGIIEDELDLRIENELLSAWGKSGRETIRLLGGIEELGEAAFEWLPNPATPTPTMLSQVQHAVASRTSDLTPLPATDTSLELLACPSIRREVETVHNHIISALTEDVTLKQTDIAVLVPRMQTYRTAFGATFDARGSLDYNLVDSTAGSDSVLAKGILHALSLAGSPFSRKAVIELLANPCVLRAMRASDEDLEIWIAWTEALGIFHHYDAEHRTRDELPPTTHHTWKQGLQRLRLGRILDTDSEAPPFADHPPYADMHTGGQMLDRFSLWLTRLYARCRTLQQRQTPEAWAITLNQFIDDFFAIPPERPQEEQVLSAVHDTLRILAGGAGTIGFGGHLTAAGSPDATLPLEWVRQYLADSIAAIPSGRGAYLTGGVTIASLLPMRPVPFRRIYILGLGEGEFPGQDNTPTLDLRTYRRRVGDTSHSDTGRYLFLETLMATRERLCLSYVARDIKKDEDKQPCSVLLQLQTCIETHLLPETTPWQPQVPPLNSYSQAYVAPAPDNTPATPQWSLAAQLLAYTAHPEATPHALTPLRSSNSLAAAAANALARTTASDTPTSPHEEHPQRVTLRELATFIKDPAEAVLRYHYRLYDLPENEWSEAEDEPLQSGFPASYTVPREALRTAFLAGDPDAGTAFVETAVATRAHASLGPADDFQSFDADALANPVEDRIGKRDNPFVALANIGAHISEPDPTQQEIPLTHPDLTPLPSLLRTPETLEVTFPEHPQVLAALTALPGKRPTKAPGLPASLLAPWLELLHRAAAQTEQPDEPRQLILIASFLSPKKPVQFSDTLSPTQARTHLATLTNDYLTTTTIQLLPYETIRKCALTTDGQLKADLTPERLATAIEDAQGAFGSYCPKSIVRLNNDRLALPDNVLELIPARLGFLFQLTEDKLAAPVQESEGPHG
jgi:exodeoxyribonuclease V gamma subunit